MYYPYDPEDLQGLAGPSSPPVVQLLTRAVPGYENRVFSQAVRGSTVNTYNAVVTVTDSAGGVATSSAQAITVMAPLTLTLSAAPLTIPAGGTVQFTANSTGGAAGSKTYNWNMGNGALFVYTPANPDQSIPSYVYPTAGTYVVNVSVKDSAGATVAAAPVTIIVTTPTAALTCTLSATPLTIPAGGTVQFTANSTGGAPGSKTYNWNMGNGALFVYTPANPAQSIPTYVYPTPGTYVVNVSVKDSAGTTVAAAPVTIIVSPIPTATISGTPTAVVSGATVSFTAAVGPVGHLPIVSYAWNFGDGSPVLTTAVANASHIYH